MPFVAFTKLTPSQQSQVRARRRPRNPSDHRSWVNIEELHILDDYAFWVMPNGDMAKFGMIEL